MSPSSVTSSTWSTASAPSGTAAPVEMRIASPSSTPTLGRSAGARLADDAQRAPGGARAHGEAVHRAVGEGGHVALGDDVLGQHAAERVLDRDVLGGSGRTAASTFARASSIVRAMARSSLPWAVGAAWAVERRSYPLCTG